MGQGQTGVGIRQALVWVPGKIQAAWEDLCRAFKCGIYSRQTSKQRYFDDGRRWEAVLCGGKEVPLSTSPLSISFLPLNHKHVEKYKLVLKGHFRKHICARSAWDKGPPTALSQAVAVRPFFSNQTTEWFRIVLNYNAKISHCCSEFPFQYRHKSLFFNHFRESYKNTTGHYSKLQSPWKWPHTVARVRQVPEETVLCVTDHCCRHFVTMRECATKTTAYMFYTCNEGQHRIIKS